MAERGPQPIPGGPTTIAEVLDAGLSDGPDREALVGRFARYSYAELDSEVRRASVALQGLGIGAGDRVACCLPNQPDLVVAFLATMRLGAIWVGISRALAPREKAFMLSDCGAAAFIADADTLGQIRPLRPELSSLRDLVDASPGDAPNEWSTLLAETGEAFGSTENSVDPFAPAAIAYTSGTTGFPKGAVHSQHNLLLVGAANRAFGAWRTELRQGAVLPLTTLNLIALCPLLAFQLKGTCICVDDPRPPSLISWIARERIASFSAVPTLVHDLVADLGTDVPLPTLSHIGVGGSACPEPVRRAYRERFGAEALPGYGLTEAPSVVASESPRGPHRPGSCGRPVPHLRVSIRAADGSELEAGRVGEICVGAIDSGPWAGVYRPFLHYWNNPEATSETLRDGVLHTGDLGYLDEEGFLFLKGRLRELIIRGGANVYPAEVERVLESDDRVVGAAVLGKPDHRLGERVVAFVQLESEEVRADDLVELCRRELARYKVPDEIEVVEAFSRNSMGKIDKAPLRTLLEERGG